MIDDVGGAVYGRSPNEYMGHALGEVFRTGKFLLTPQGAAFLVKQNALMARNKQRYYTSVKYGISLWATPSKHGDRQLNAIKFIGDSFENPRSYNDLLNSLSELQKNILYLKKIIANYDHQKLGR